MDWISIRDALPPEDTDVLVNMKDRMAVGNMSRLFANPVWEIYDDRGMLVLEAVTHWMPLPAPPGKEADGLDKGQ